MSANDNYLESLLASVNTDNNAVPNEGNGMNSFVNDFDKKTSSESNSMNSEIELKPVETNNRNEQNSSENSDELSENDIERLLSNMDDEKDIFKNEEDVASENFQSDDDDIEDILKDISGDTGNFESYLDEVPDQSDIEQKLKDASTIAPFHDVETVTKDTFEDILGHDSEMSEINDLLQKTQNDEPIEDEILAMLDNFEQKDSEGKESTQGMFDNPILSNTSNQMNDDINSRSIEDDNNLSDLSKRKNKKEKKKKEKSKKKDIPNDDFTDEIDEVIDKKDKQSFSLFKKKEKKTEKSENQKIEKEMISSIDDGSGIEIDPSLLDELEEKNEKKKDKKSKKYKKTKSKSKKIESTALSENEVIESELDKENASRKKKKVKKLKEKKVKVAKPAEPEKKYKKISNMGIAAVFIICLSLGGALITCCIMLPASISNKKAVQAFYNEDYDEVVDLLYGRNLSKGMQTIYEESRIICKCKGGIDIFENRIKLSMKKEAIDALLTGYQTCSELNSDAEKYQIEDKVSVISNQYLSILSENYGIISEDVDDIILMDDLTYTILLEDIVQKGKYEGNLYPNDATQEDDSVSTNLSDPKENELVTESQKTSEKTNFSTRPDSQKSESNKEELNKVDSDKGNTNKEEPSQEDANKEVPDTLSDQKELYNGAVEDGNVIVQEDISQ